MPVITSYRDLINEIERLGNLPTGFTRVFRGQTKDYGKMLPTGLRTALGRNEHIFHSYARGLVEDILHFSPSLERPDDVGLWFIWIDALAQHYGPGSRFLDVSKSLDVGLWFALYKMVEVNLPAVMGPEGPLDPEYDEPTNLTWSQYRRWEDAPGWLYVFHVPKWNGEGYPAHGNLLDLSEGPSFIASSKRMVVQAGCMLAARPKAGEGDLQEFYACNPIRVAWPMVGAEKLTAPTEDMFPTPAQDDWYSRFLSLPLVHTTDAKTKKLRLAHPVSIRLYLADHDQALEDADRRIIRISPPLLFPALVDNPRTNFPAVFSDLWNAVRLCDATPIVLESPLMAITPPIEGNYWSHALLTNDMSTAIEALDFETSGSAGQVALTNVFVEFSPLEKSGWERVEQPGWGITWLRSMWIVRNLSQYGIRACFQVFAARESELMFAEPLVVEFDRASKRFRCRAENDSKAWGTVSDFPDVMKAFFVILTILRELSPIMKVSPFPARIAQSKDKEWLMAAFLHEADARLFRVADTRSRTFHLVRDILSGEPYSGSSLDRGIFFEPSSSWADIDANSVRKKVVTELIRHATEMNQQNRDAEALQLYEKVINDFGGRTDIGMQEVVAMAGFNRGVTLTRLKRSDQAILAYEDLVRQAGQTAGTSATLDRLTAQALAARGYELNLQARKNEAIASYDEVIKRFQSSQDASLRAEVEKSRKHLAELEPPYRASS
jgi:tetratricopeptide (TPR) repeat protein